MLPLQNTINNINKHVKYVGVIQSFFCGPPNLAGVWLGENQRTKTTIMTNV